MSNYFDKFSEETLVATTIIINNIIPPKLSLDNCDFQWTIVFVSNLFHIFSTLGSIAPLHWGVLVFGTCNPGEYSVSTFNPNTLWVLLTQILSGYFQPKYSVDTFNPNIQWVFAATQMAVLTKEIAQNLFQNQVFALVRPGRGPNEQPSDNYVLEALPPSHMHCCKL